MASNTVDDIGGTADFALVGTSGNDTVTPDDTTFGFDSRTIALANVGSAAYRDGGGNGGYRRLAA